MSAARTTAWFVIALYPIVFVAVVTGQLMSSHGAPGTAIVGMLIVGAFPIGFWLGALRPFIRAEDKALVVRNPLSTRRIEYGDIVRCRPGYSGLAILTRNGVVVAWAVQKSNFASWRHQRTRADDVAAFIEQRRGRAPQDA